MLIGAKVSAQILPHAGTHFTFGIPEGPDGLVDPSLGTGASVLTLNIVSIYDGRGIITSPSGFCQEFTFTANNATTINLPYSLMQLTDLGKTNKGIIVKTSQPANAVFHDFLLEAGEATQIYPDEALDTDYRITSWGVFDDPGEDNHSEFVITATQDNTDVTIVPSVQALGNHAAGVPIQVVLNRGECYIVKADNLAAPTTSLSNSVVHSSKPVSVIAGITCGYVPLAVESCNEMIDEVLPKKITGTTFYVVPLRDGTVENTVLFTSDNLNFSLLTAAGIFYSTTTGRIVLTVDKPSMFTVTAPSQCFLLAEGSALQSISDPSIVTILPPEQYFDTMVWFTPPFIGQVRFQNTPFENFVSVVYPKASEGQVLLDGAPIASVTTPKGIIGSQMSGAVVNIQPGVHRLTSPVPIFATVAGFSEADGYSFFPGGVGPKLPIDTLPASLNISATTAQTCRTFDATVSTSFHAQDNINSAKLTITYDAALLTVVSSSFGATAQGAGWVSDIRTPGKIFITASCLTPFTDSGIIVTIKFATGPSVTTTPITADLQEFGGESIYGIFAASVKKDISIEEVRDTAKATYSIKAGTTRFGNHDTAVVTLLTIPNEAITDIILRLSYNHDVMHLLSADLLNTLAVKATATVPVPIDTRTDELSIKVQPPMVFTAPGVLARLIFDTYVSDSTSSNIGLQASLLNSRPCPLDILSDTVSNEFFGSDTCGSSSLRAILRNQPFAINSITPNPSKGSFTIDLDRHLFDGPLHVSLVDILGNEVWSTFHLSPDINQKISCTLQNAVPNGTYFVRVSGSGRIETRKIVIRN